MAPLPDDLDKTAVWTPEPTAAAPFATEEKTMVLGPSAGEPSWTNPEPPEGPLSPPLSPQQPGPVLARFSLRLVSRWIDGCVISLAGLSAGAALGALTMGGAISAALAFLYFGAAHGWKGKTLGKKLMGLKLVEVSGAQVAYKKAFVRALADWLNFLTFGIGYLLIFTKRRQPLHDILCKTQVIVVSRRPMWALLAGLLFPVLAWGTFCFIMGAAMFFGPQVIKIREMSPIEISAQAPPVPAAPSAPSDAETPLEIPRPAAPREMAPKPDIQKETSTIQPQELPRVESENLASELEKKAKEYIEDHQEIDADSCRDFAILGNARFRKVLIETSCGEGVGAKMRLIAVNFQSGWRIVRKMKAAESLDPKTGVFRQK
ncbi:MAG: RDD family protein [Elusimicrobia bacterium]|nr:RDD family protein [Elusimicrobiota bacterium]